MVVLFTAVIGGLGRAGHEVVTLDGSALGLDSLPGLGAGSGGSGGGRSGAGAWTFPDSVISVASGIWAGSAGWAASGISAARCRTGWVI